MVSPIPAGYHNVTPYLMVAMRRVRLRSIEKHSARAS